MKLFTPKDFECYHGFRQTNDKPKRIRRTFCVPNIKYAGSLFCLLERFELMVQKEDIKMTISLQDFLLQLIEHPVLIPTTILILGVVLVNGWTDAPNAIATCVSTKAITPRKAIGMAAFFNFLGVFVMTMFNASVATTIFRMVDFGTNTKNALYALCAAMVSIVIWATAAWYFGIPTSESHALIAGLSGAAIALQGGLKGINGEEWIKVIYGLLLSTVLGFVSGFFVVKGVTLLCRKKDRRTVKKYMEKGQVAGGAAMAFMHGAQDGQKFMGVFMLGLFLVNGPSNCETTAGLQMEYFPIPIWLMILCSGVMALGTSIGGLRIIKAVGMDMVKMETYQGFSADLAGAGCLLLSSIIGIPVSTTHTKTVAVMGVGAAKGRGNVNWKVVQEMVLTWILTFPGCGAIGFIMAKLFMMLS